ncbi:MAG TPA: hypothetical protein VIN59_05720 [Alphaproteobacteria bacterium]
MSRQFKGKKIKLDRGPSMSLDAFLGVVHGFETTSGKSARRTTFASVLNGAQDAELVGKGELQSQFGFSARQIGLARGNRSTGATPEQRNTFIAQMKQRALTA